MLAALATSSLVPVVRSFAHGPQRLRQGYRVGLDLLQTLTPANAQRATINAAGEFTNSQGVSGSEAFGASVSVLAATSIGIGASISITANAPESVVVGQQASVSDSLGNGQAVVVGKFATCTYGYGVAIGYGMGCTAASQGVLGNSTTGITDWFLGKGVVHTAPVGTAINATGGSGANVSGAALSINGGICTGNATGGAISLKTSPTGTAGSSQNALVERLRVNYDGGVHIKELAAAPAAVSGFVRIYGYSTMLAIGNGATVGLSYDSQVAIGTSATANNYSATAVGWSANASGTGGTALGSGAGASAIGATALGYNATSAGGVAIGGAGAGNSNPAAAGDVTFGDGTSATYKLSDFYPFSKLNNQSRTCTIHGPDSVAGTDKASYPFVIGGGRGTGTGTGGYLSLQTSPIGSTGSTRQTLTERVRIAEDGGVHIKELAAAPTAVSGFAGLWTNSNQSVAFGYNVGIGTSTNSIAIGNASGTNGASRSVFLGYSTTGWSDSIAIGAAATTTTTNQLVIGSTSSAINDAYIGNGVTNASPGAVAINATGGSGTNIAGANLTLAAGKGTGSGVGGYLSFQTAPAGSSGTTLGTLVERMRINTGGGIEFPVLAAAPTFTSGVIRLWGSTSNLAFGVGASIDVTRTKCISIGYGAICTEVNSSSVGADSQVGGQDGTAIGYKSAATALGSTAIGANSYASGVGGISIGAQASLGDDPAGAHQVKFGSGLDSNRYIGDFFPFSALNTQARTCTIYGPDSNTGTNQNAAGDFVIAGPRGTGTGTAGSIKLQAPVTQASGTTRHTLASVVEVQTDSKLGFYAVTPVARQLFATGASHTVDELITVLQTLGLIRQS